MHLIRVATVVLTLVCVLLDIGAAGADEIAPSQHVDLEAIINRHSSRPVNEYAQFREPSYPLAVETVLPEWTTAEAVVLAVPSSSFLADKDLSNVVVQLAAVALKYADVIILCDDNGSHTQKLLLEHLQQAGLMKYVIDEDGPRLKLVPCRLDSVWIRDYGPIFLRDVNQHICYADAIYRDIQAEPQSSLLIQGGALRLSDRASRQRDDVAPVYLANYLRNLHGSALPSERVPMQLWGGDIAVDSLGNAFISTDTLVMNGGRDEEVRYLLSKYYGVRHLTYLSALPGPTIKHLDMLFKVIDDHTFLVADYPEALADDDDRLMHYLHREARRVLEQNVKVLQQQFPDRKVLRVPMPPLERREFFKDHGWQYLAAVFAQKGLDVPDCLSTRQGECPVETVAYVLRSLEQLEGTVQGAQLQRRATWLTERIVESDKDVLAWLAASVFPADESSQSGDTVASEDGTRARLQDIVRRTIDSKDANLHSYIYRSYTNSLFVNGPRGKVVLLPSYAGYEQIERQVVDIYQKAYPGSDVELIDCEHIIRLYGAIHCMSITVPAF